MIKRLGLALLALLVLLAVVLLGNTFRQGSRQVQVAALPPLAVDGAAVTESMVAAVRARTVSGLLDPSGTAAEFDKLHAHLAARYPLLHAKLQREVIGGHTLLYTWTGKDPKAQPVGLMAHQDVVPIAPGTEALWKKPPFEGVVEGGYVWGRGTLDDKVNLVTQMEAVERLLKDGFQPRRTVYLIAGVNGSGSLAPGRSIICLYFTPSAVLESRSCRVRAPSCSRFSCTSCRSP